MLFWQSDKWATCGCFGNARFFVVLSKKSPLLSKKKKKKNIDLSFSQQLGGITYFVGLGVVLDERYMYLHNNADMKKFYRPIEFLTFPQMFAQKFLINS